MANVRQERKVAISLRRDVARPNRFQVKTGKIVANSDPRPRLRQSKTWR